LLIIPKESIVMMDCLSVQMTGKNMGDPPHPRNDITETTCFNCFPIFLEFCFKAYLMFNTSTVKGRNFMARYVENHGKIDGSKWQDLISGGHHWARLILRVLIKSG